MDFGSDPPKEQGANMLPVYFSGPCFGDSTPTGPPTSPVPQVGGRLDAVGSDEEVDELQDDTGAQGSPVLMGSSPESYMLTSSQDEVDELEETMSEESVGMAVGEGADNIERAMVLGSSQDEVDELEGSTDEDMGDNLSTNGSTSARPGLLISLDDGTAGDSDLVVGADALSEGLLDIAIEPTRSSSAYTAPISGGDGAYSDLMGISFEASPVEEGSPMSASGNVAHAQEDVEFEVLSSSPVSEGAFQQGGVVHRGAAFGHKADDSAVQSAEDERCASGDEINREQLGFYRGLMVCCFLKFLYRG
ncbi:hypothetical protein DFP72DRAFT_560496 [Ephemerocybe angulata]|uniref:Uncharacterized protein n=1 Tax=Ephemerocybe angulata TaxID=980116 RepID=A0A8H6MBR7_9AGAR|nr:hypothetical protein DFP72DRAFT_560496 [Tulosesus angulatus]